MSSSKSAGHAGCQNEQQFTPRFGIFGGRGSFFVDELLPAFQTFCVYRFVKNLQVCRWPLFSQSGHLDFHTKSNLLHQSELFQKTVYSQKVDPVRAKQCCSLLLFAVETCFKKGLLLDSRDTGTIARKPFPIGHDRQLKLEIFRFRNDTLVKQRLNR